MRVLVVDDDPTLLRRIKQALEEKGHDVVTAKNGGIAFDLLVNQETEVDAIITDMRMPLMTGAELLQAIWRGDNTPPTLLHSSDTSGWMSNRQRIDDLDEFTSYFDFAQFHKKKRDLGYIHNFLNRAEEVADSQT